MLLLLYSEKYINATLIFIMLNVTLHYTLQLHNNVQLFTVYMSSKTVNRKLRSKQICSS